MVFEGHVSADVGDKLKLFVSVSVNVVSVSVNVVNSICCFQEQP